MGASATTAAIISGVGSAVGGILASNNIKRDSKDEASRLRRLGESQKIQIGLNLKYLNFFDVDVKRLQLEKEFQTKRSNIKNVQASAAETSAKYSDHQAALTSARGRLSQHSFDLTSDNVRLTAAFDKMALVRYGYDMMDVMDAQRRLLVDSDDKKSQARVEAYSAHSSLSSARFSRELQLQELKAARHASFEQSSTLEVLLGEQRVGYASGNVALGSQSVASTLHSTARQGATQISRVVQAGLLQSKRHALEANNYGLQAASNFERAARYLVQADESRKDAFAKNRDIEQLGIEHSIEAGRIDVKEDFDLKQLDFDKQDARLQTDQEVSRHRITAYNQRVQAYSDAVAAIILEQEAGWSDFSQGVAHTRRELAEEQETINLIFAEDYALQARNIVRSGKRAGNLRLVTGITDSLTAFYT